MICIQVFLLSIYSNLKTNTTCIWYDLVEIKTGEKNWCFHMLKSFMMIHGGPMKPCHGLGFANSPWSWQYSKAGLGVWTVSRQKSCRCFFHTPQKFTWNLEMMLSNRNLLFQGSIFRFHVCFGGV